MPGFVQLKLERRFWWIFHNTDSKKYLSLFNTDFHNLYSEDNCLAIIYVIKSVLCLIEQWLISTKAKKVIWTTEKFRSNKFHTMFPGNPPHIITRMVSRKRLPLPAFVKSLYFLWIYFLNLNAIITMLLLYQEVVALYKS